MKKFKHLIFVLTLLISLSFITFTSCKKIDDTKDKILTSIEISNVKTYSDDKLQENLEFVNKGSVIINKDNNTIKVDKMEPKDKITLDIKVTNDSFMDVKSNVVISSLNNSELFKEMDILIDEKHYHGMNAYTNWYTLGMKDDNKSKLFSVTISYPKAYIVTKNDTEYTIKIENDVVMASMDKNELKEKDLGIKTLQDLTLLKDAINNEYDFKGHTFKLLASIDGENKEFTSILNNHNKLDNVVIDGNNHSIKNLKLPVQDNGGFISYNTSKLTIKNIIFDNFMVETTTDKNQTYAGVIIGKNYANVMFENVKVINSKVKNNWQCGGFVGYSETYTPTFKDSEIENTYIGGKNATSGCFFGLGVVDIKLENCKAKNVKLFTDGLTWDSTQKLNNNYYVGHLYGKTLTTTNCKEENITVVDKE